METEQLQKSLGHKTHNLPDGWEMKELSAVCEKVLDGTHFSPKSNDGPFRYITSKNIRNDGLDLDNCNYISEEEHRKIFKRCPVQFGDLLLTKDGANTGNCCQNTLKEEFSLLSSVAVLKAANEKVDNRYLLQSLKSPRGQSEIKNAMAGQAITRITLEKIKNFVFPFPPLPQQRKIAAILSTWDEAIQTADQLVKAKKERKRGLMQQLLTGQKRLPGFSREWTKKSVNNLISESRISLAQSDPNRRITVKLNLNGVEKRDLKREEKEQATIYYKRRAGQFIYGKQNLHKGAMGIIPNELDGFASSQDIPTFDFTDQAHPDWFLAYMSQEHFFTDLEKIATGTGSKRIHPQNLYKVKIHYPSLDEQRAITEVLNAVDEEIRLAKAEMEALKQQKRGLMQQLLTGQTLVTVNEQN